MNVELLKELLLIAIANSVVMTLFIQKIKETFNVNSKMIVFISFVINMVIGSLFSLSFSDVSLINSIWIGFFSFVGADTIYKTLEDKVFKSITELKKEKEEVEEIKYDL